MKKVTPYKSLNGAMKALDNGGRFYNFLTQANDGEVTSAELAKAAGVFSDTQRMIIYLEMTLSDFDKNLKNNVLSHLSTDLKRKYEKYLPAYMLPSEAEKVSKVNASAIITGVPKKVDSKNELTGFIMIPISTGKTMSMIMVPIFEKYDIYEVRDTKSDSKFFIAHAKGNTQLPEKMFRLGGVIKELRRKKNESKASGKFLEVTHYIPLD